MSLPVYRLSLHAAMYWGTSGGSAPVAAPTTISPLANQLGNVRDVTLVLESQTLDVDIRGRKFELGMPGLLKAEVQFDMLEDSDDTGQAAMLAAYLAGSMMAFQIVDLDSAAGTGTGIQADFLVTKFGRSEKLGNMNIVSATLKPGISTYEPTWVAVLT